CTACQGRCQTPGDCRMSLDDRWAGHHIRTLTTPQVLAERARTLGDKVFLDYLPDGRKFSYADIDRLSNQLAHGFAKRGVGHGTHVACLMDNSPEQLLTYFALGKLGAVAVPLNTASRGPSLHYLLSHSDAVALVIDEALWSNYAEVAAELDNIRQIVCLGANQDQIVARKTDIEVVDFSDLYEADQSLPEATVSFNDPSYIIYTSGT